VPTMNRSQFIERLLSYYDTLQFKGTVYIADSSNDESHLKRNQDLARIFSGKLKVFYGHYPDVHIEEAKRLVLDNVSEKYAAYCGDDDFLLPDVLTECARFLEGNSDYSNCHGIGLSLKMDNDQLYGSVEVVSDYKLLGNELNDSQARLAKYFSDYWPIWSVRRVDEFKETLFKIRDIPIEGFREITMGCLPIILGKTKLIDELYVVRQVHKGRFQSPNPLYSVVLDEWHTSYAMMSDVLANEVCSVSNVQYLDVKESIKEGFLEYFTRVVNSQFCRFGNKTGEKWKKIVKRLFPGFKKIYFRYLIPGINLSKLNNVKFKHHDNFSKVAIFLKSKKHL